MGASEGNLPELTVDAVKNVQANIDAGEGYEPATEQQTTQESPAEYKLSGPAQAIFDKIPEGERGKVAAYFEELDKSHQQGFTKYAQDTQAELKAYKDLGSPDDLRVAAATYHTVLTDPQIVYDWLVMPKSQGGGGLTPKQAVREVNERQAEAEGTSEFDDDPRLKTLLEKQTQSEQLLTGIASWIQQQDANTRLEADKQVYFGQIDDAMQKHGKVPDDDMHFIHRIVGSGHGVTPEQAVAEYHRIRQSGVNEARTKPPTLLGGGGTPRPPSNINDMNEDERLKYMASRIMEINAGNQ